MEPTPDTGTQMKSQMLWGPKCLEERHHWILVAAMIEHNPRRPRETAEVKSMRKERGPQPQGHMAAEAAAGTLRLSTRVAALLVPILGIKGRLWASCSAPLGQAPACQWQQKDPAPRVSRRAKDSMGSS